MTLKIGAWERSGLTAPEAGVVLALIKAWDAFVQLPVEHPDAQTEFRHGIHALQNQIFARPALRKLHELEPEE